MIKTINIVEPTLINEAGHCYSLVNNLVNAEQKSCVVVWASKHSTINFKNTKASLKKFFYRRVRKIQCYFLYRKLLASGDKILVSTSGMIDLMLFTLIAKETIPPKKVFFYFHWINNTSRKLNKLKEIAKKQPNLMILGTTPTVLEIFKKAGFQYTEVAPYPISKKNEPQSTEPNKFSKVLFAGAARQDKGFSRVVDLIEYETAENSTIPFFIQSSSEHYNKYDKKTQYDIGRLSAAGYKYLTIHKDTLSESEYLNLFIGSICIQPYDHIAFADRVSGVTLDALVAGSPILTSADTWTAKLVEKFSAGIVMKSTTPEEMHIALTEVISKYEFYSNNARNASKILQAENDSIHLTSLMSG
jgi:hypothetical protein